MRTTLLLAFFVAACASKGSAPSGSGGGGTSTSSSSSGTSGGGGGPVMCKPPLTPCDGNAGASCVDTSTDGKNCGACGVDCGGASCTAGLCGVVTLATFGGDTVVGSGTQPLAIDATDVYFYAAYGPPGGDVSIAKVSKAGGAIIPVLKTDAAAGVYSFPASYALDDTMLYFVDFKSLRSVPKAGGAAVTIATLDVNSGAVGGDLRLTGNSLDLAGASGISSVPKTGGAPSVVVQEPKVLFDFTHDATAYYWLTCDFTLKRQTPGGVPTVVAQYTATGNCPLSFDASDTELFFGGDYDGLLHQTGKDGTKKPDLQAKYSAQSHLAHNASTLFWVEDTVIRARPIAGGSPVDLVTGLVVLTALVADDVAIYWSEGVAQNQGAIKKMVLPR